MATHFVLVSGFVCLFVCCLFVVFSWVGLVENGLMGVVGCWRMVWWRVEGGWWRWKWVRLVWLLIVEGLGIVAWLGWLVFE